MRFNSKITFVIIFLFATPGAVSAHPVSFKGSVGLMPEYSKERRQLDINYSAESFYAFGVSAISLDLENDDATFLIPRLNYKAYRRNELESQMNLYLSLGIGGVEFRDEKSVSGLGGFQADYETRRIYTLLSGETLQSEGSVDNTMIRYRAGVAPYLADFEGFHTWIIGQVDYNADQEDRWVVTPLLRFFYQNYLLEAGSSINGDLFVAGIFHF